METEERILTFMESMAPEQTAFLNRIEQEALDAAVPIIRTQTRSLIQFLMMAERPRRILEIGTGTGFSACVMLTYAPGDAELVTIEKDPQRAGRARETFAAFREETESHAAAGRTGGAFDMRENTAREDMAGDRSFAGPATCRTEEIPAGSPAERGPADEKPESAPGEGSKKPAAAVRIGRITLMEADASEILPVWNGKFDFIFMDAAKGQYIHFLPDVLRLLNPGGILLSDNIFREGEILESRYAVRRRNRTIHKRMREYLSALTRNPALQTLLLQEGDGAALTLKKPADVEDASVWSGNSAADTAG